MPTSAPQPVQLCDYGIAPMDLQFTRQYESNLVVLIFISEVEQHVPCQRRVYLTTCSSRCQDAHITPKQKASIPLLYLGQRIKDKRHTGTKFFGVIYLRYLQGHHLRMYRATRGCSGEDI